MQTLSLCFMLILTGCATAAPAADPTITPTHAIATRASIDDTRPTDTPQPTITPVITRTPLPTAEASQEAAAPTPLPADQRDYELCVSIASDSNGYGHVTFQRPDTGQIAITYITPIAVPLQEHLHALGITYLSVIDRSLSAGGVTLASSNYLESDQFFRLKEDRCQFVIVTPFYPDVAVNIASPQFYLTNLNWLLDGVTEESKASRILVLNYYQTDRAPFTADNSGRGLTSERIDAFNAAIAESCQSGILAEYDQVTCIDVRPFFEGMASPHVLGDTTRADYEAALYRTNRFSEILDDYFASHPDGALIGDGIHLSLAGRDRLAEHLAQIILDMLSNL
jgi:hypothetical protein